MNNASPINCEYPLPCPECGESPGVRFRKRPETKTVRSERQCCSSRWLDDFEWADWVRKTEAEESGRFHIVTRGW